jgi:hypothetical protein
MTSYDDGLSVGDARDRYFAQNGFPAGYDDRWVRLRLGRRMLPIFPNTRARVAAVRIHDLHHVATGYDTSWTGEGEISAWELASGCGPYLAAWVLNLGGFSIGCCLAPRRMLRAFVRGRHSKNLYAKGFDPARLAQSVGALRSELELDRTVPAATSNDLIAFSGWAALGLLYSVGGTLSLAVTSVALWKQPRALNVTAPAPSAPQDAAPAPAAAAE